jgi:hypothetical protein
VALQAAVAIEPPRLRLGDVAQVEVSVVTPPGHRVRPIAPPAAVEGLWLLDAESLPVEADGARLVHRTRIRVRARALGAAAWPALAVEVEGADGAIAKLATEERPIEVVSVLPGTPERGEPFPFRLPETRARGPGPLAAAAAGAASTLLGVALVALARRSRRRSLARRAQAAAVAASQPWIEALDALARAHACADWREAASTGARALRRYVARRFGVAAAEASPVEELAAQRGPALLPGRWREAVACLDALDGDRFRALPPDEAPARVREALDAAARLVRDTSPADEAGDA